MNGYIALGWDLISPELICDAQKGKDAKVELIADLYENEKRPGLIYGQMDTFYNRMSIGDLIVIPSAGGKRIQIGILGDFQDEVVHKISEDEYPMCSYIHKRHVDWIKEVESYQDVYLFETLRAQQTISDITCDAELVLRNLYSVYISGQEIHLTLLKKTTSEFGLANNADLFVSLLSVMDETASLYEMRSFRNEIAVKTAVGSPGFIEFILPNTSVAVIAAIIIKFLIGKVKGTDGSTVTGILAIIEEINTMINDYHNRKKADADTKLLEAQEAKANADASLSSAQARKAEAEAREIELKNMRYEQIELLSSGLTSVQFQEQQEQLTVPDNSIIGDKSHCIAEAMDKVCEAASRNELSFDGKRIENAS